MYTSLCKPIYIIICNTAKFEQRCFWFLLSSLGRYGLAPPRRMSDCGALCSAKFKNDLFWSWLGGRWQWWQLDCGKWWSTHGDHQKPKQEWFAGIGDGDVAVDVWSKSVSMVAAELWWWNKQKQTKLDQTQGEFSKKMVMIGPYWWFHGELKVFHDWKNLDVRLKFHLVRHGLVHLSLF